MLMESGDLVPAYRKNAFHLVVFVNVFSPLSGILHDVLKRIEDTGEALRLGVVAYSKDHIQNVQSPLKESELTASPILSNVFHYVKDVAGMYLFILFEHYS